MLLQFPSSTADMQMIQKSWSKRISSAYGTIKVPPASGTTNGNPTPHAKRGGMRRWVHPPCLFKPYDVRNHHFVTILPNLSSVAILPFWWYLHMRLWLFVHFFIYALTFFGTKHFSSRKIFKNNLHTYTKPLNTH